MSRFSDMKLRTKVAIGATLGAAVLGGGGMLAFAYFTSTGSGTGSAGVGSSGPVAIAQTNVVSGLVPGGPAQTIDYTVTNSNPGNQYVGQVTVAASGVANGDSNTGIEACTAGMFTIVQGTPINTDVAGHGGTAIGTATIALVDDGNNQDNCQNATVNLSFSSN